MTITIENADKNLVKAIKSVANLKSEKVKVKVKRSEKEIAEEWQKEVDEIMRDYKAGKIKTFKTAEEMHKDIFKNV